jgi:hypothetical protein
MTVSFAGLDLSFMKNDPPIRSRRPKKRAPDKRSPLGCPMLMNDIKEFVSHATDRPVRITSRSQLAAYERSNNIRQCGDYKPGEVVAREKKRIQKGIDNARAMARKVRVSTDWV